MASIGLLIPLIPLAILGYFGWRRYRYGSLVGGVLGARVVATVGEVALRTSPFTSSTFRVHVLEAQEAGPRAVGLAIVSKAPLAAAVRPVRLSREQALALARLLEEAAR